jgi:hypothetical protein
MAASHWVCFCYTSHYNRFSHEIDKVPLAARVAAGAFGFFIFNHAFDGPDLYGALSFFETTPSRPSLQTAFEQFRRHRVRCVVPRAATVPQKFS